MDSNFTHSIDKLKRISGNANGDDTVAKTAVKEMEEFITSNSAVISEYLDLQRVLTSNSSAEIRCKLISIKHVMRSLSYVQNFHRQGQLNDIFDISKHRMLKVVEQTESDAKELLEALEC